MAVARRWGRFNKERDAAVVHDTSDPYLLRPYAQHYALHAERFLHALAAPSRLRLSDLPWFFPAGPPFVQRYSDELGTVEQVQEMKSATNYPLRNLGADANNDTPVDAARAFLRCPAVDGVSLRAHYVRVLRTFHETVEKQASRETSVMQMYGIKTPPQLNKSLALFDKAAGAGFDDEVHALVTKATSAITGLDGSTDYQTWDHIDFGRLRTLEPGSGRPPRRNADVTPATPLRELAMGTPVHRSGEYVPAAAVPSIARWGSGLSPP